MRAKQKSKELLSSQINLIRDGKIKDTVGGRWRPAKISVAVDLVTGKMYVGYCGARKSSDGIVHNPSVREIHSVLQERIENTKKLAKESPDNPYKNEESFEKWSVDNCAEIYAVNNALRDGALLDNLYINSVFYKDGETAPPCKNCERTFNGCLLQMSE